MNLVAPTDPILRAVMPHYDGEPRELRPVADRMFEIIDDRANPGIGLAAPQIGQRLRLFVMNVGRRYVCINPAVVALTGPFVSRTEGCLSRPGEGFLVSRREQIVAVWTDLHGQECHGELRGIVARCFQHELDHLNGKCIFDPATPALDHRAVLA